MKGFDHSKPSMLDSSTLWVGSVEHDGEYTKACLIPSA